MTKHQGYTSDDLEAVSDNPEWTADDFAAARPFGVVFPDLAATIDEAQRETPDAQVDVVRVPIDRDLVDVFKAEGPGWEARLNKKLRQAVHAA